MKIMPGFSHGHMPHRVPGRKHDLLLVKWQARCFLPAW